MRRSVVKTGEFTRPRGNPSSARNGCDVRARSYVRWRIIADVPERGRGPMLTDFRQEFLAFAVARDVLRFGSFVTKAGRTTPYFFNAGLFDDGESVRLLGRYYADALLA